MKAEYIEDLADAVDPEKLWQISPWDACSLSESKRERRDIGIALYLYAQHIRSLEALVGTGKSLLLTPVSKSSVLQSTIRTGSCAAVCDVATERLRQVTEKGWTPTHDDEHVNDELAALACFYAMPPGARDWPAKETGFGDTLGEAILPPDWSASAGDRRAELVKAGALIIAEIERIDRATRAAKLRSDATDDSCVVT